MPSDDGVVAPLPGLAPAARPRSVPMPAVKATAQPIRSSVVGNRSRITATTGRPNTADVPRSPCRTRHRTRTSRSGGAAGEAEALAQLRGEAGIAAGLGEIGVGRVARRALEQKVGAERDEEERRHRRQRAASRRAVRRAHRPRARSRREPVSAQCDVAQRGLLATLRTLSRATVMKVNSATWISGRSSAASAWKSPVEARCARRRPSRPPPGR